MSNYDMLVYLTPLGVDKFYNRGLLEGVKYFSLSDNDANYLTYDDLTYSYDMTTGGTYSPDTVELGFIANLRGTVDRNQIIDRKVLNTNIMSLSSPIWRYPIINPTEEFLAVYKESNDENYSDKPIVLGGRNMWHADLTTGVNNNEGFLFYIPPTVQRRDYINIEEPTIGDVTTGALDHVPFPGVSVNDGRRSFTEIQYFEYINRSSQPMKITSFSVENILPISHSIMNTVTDENYSSEFIKQSYYLDWVCIKDGKSYIDAVINVFIPRALYDRSDVILLPYEVAKFGVSFEIYEAGSIITHWHGQSYGDQSVQESEYNFDLRLNSELEHDATMSYKATMNVVVKVKSSVYNPNTYTSPMPIDGTEITT